MPHDFANLIDRNALPQKMSNDPVANGVGGVRARERIHLFDFLLPLPTERRDGIVAPRRWGGEDESI